MFALATVATLALHRPPSRLSTLSRKDHGACGPLPFLRRRPVLAGVLRLLLDLGVRAAVGEEEVDVCVCLVLGRGFRRRRTVVFDAEVGRGRGRPTPPPPLRGSPLRGSSLRKHLG